MPIISIIVPVYKVEKYLHRCIDSILKQTFTDFDCILIDDGSPDSCPAICDDYAIKDNRIVVVHQKNRGVSAARNAGLDNAQGEWIVFVDSDDWLEPCALEKLYNKQCETNADIVIGSFKEYYRDRAREIIFDVYIISDKQKMLSDFFLKKYKNVWGKLYRSSLFEDITQPSNFIYGEDAVVNFQIINSASCHTVVEIKDIVYNYDRTTGGISQELICSPEKAINFFESYVFIYNFLKQKEIFYINIKKYYYTYVFAVVLVKLFYNVPKNEALRKLKIYKFPYIYFSANIKSIFYNIMNCLFLVNQNLYKTIIRKYYNLRLKI